MNWLQRRTGKSRSIRVPHPKQLIKTRQSVTVYLPITLLNLNVNKLKKLITTRRCVVGVRAAEYACALVVVFRVEKIIIICWHWYLLNACRTCASTDELLCFYNVGKIIGPPSSIYVGFKHFMKYIFFFKFSLNFMRLN